MDANPPPPTGAQRTFGRFELRQMLGRSQSSSSWLAFDPHLKEEVLLCLPRAMPVTQSEKSDWSQDVLAGARLKHPHLADVLEVGSHEGWPFLTCARKRGMTLAERVSSGPALTPLECATVVVDVLEGLAYAHEAGLAHRDIGLHNILIDKGCHAELAAIGVGLEPRLPGQIARPQRSRQEQRQATERDVLMVGLLMHRLLMNQPALDEPDLGKAALRIGQEIVRLPWTTPHLVPETLRAIVNRATDRQQRQRYLNARTLLNAMQGWVKTNANDAGGPLMLLLDRLNTVGALPGARGGERVFLQTLTQDSLRVDELVDVLVKNPALSWELLRAVNVVSVRGEQADDGVTTLSRAIMLLGQNGLRKVSGAVRAWPGALAAHMSVSEEGGRQAITALERELRLTCLAGHIARLVAPFTINDEEAAIAAMSQRLGWLLVLYHFPEEAAQIKRLMLPEASAEPGGVPTPGMTLETACGAVLGINLDELSVAVLRHWGLHDRLIYAVRPLNRENTVRMPGTPEEILRTVASMACELTDASLVDGAKGTSSAVHQVYVRYVRALQLTPQECTITLDHANRLLDGRPVDREKMLRTLRPQAATPSVIG